MLRRTFEIVAGSFRMAILELWKNKLRTFLSLFGITIGIFCIIGVLAVVNSLQRNIENEIQSLGSNTIYVDKWDYSAGGDGDYPWWKFVNRPVPKFEEVKLIQERTTSAKYTAFCLQTSGTVDFKGSSLNNVKQYGISEEFEKIQPLEIAHGRFISDAEFNSGSQAVVVGNEIAEKLFGDAELAINKQVVIRGKKASICGVIKKRGKQMIGGWDFDQSVLITYKYARTMMNELKADPVIMVQGKDNLSSKALKDDLFGTMRAIRKINPTQEPNFALNDVNDFTDAIGGLFVGLNIGGAVIGGISLIVGLFGVANIMFVTVRERTAQIGLKKAIGAKKNMILTEFLLESAFLCIIGGLIGLSLVYILSLILSGALDFPVFISVGNMVWTFIICVAVGIIAGIVPASQAARMDPVVAIRSK